MKFFNSEAQKQLLKSLLDNHELLPAEERDKLIKNLIANLDNLDRYYSVALILLPLLKACILLVAANCFFFFCFKAKVKIFFFLS